jgi:hypothetical protein
MRVGYGKHALPRQAVQQCQRMLGDVRPWLLIAFAGGKHDPAQILRALREAFGDDVPVVGGSAAGVIGREVESYSGLELGLIAFHDPATTPQILVTDGLRTGEVEAGRELGERIATVAADNAVVLILYDSVRHAAPLQLHPASAIVEGLQQGLHGRRLHLVGGGMLTDMNLSDSWVFDGRAVALQIGGPAGWGLVAVALIATSCGLGLFQVVVFHHCAHGSVFADWRTNRDVGRLISALLLFKHFDAYRREHNLHHNARKLFTDEDEFADFVLDMCRLEPGLPKGELWRRVIMNVAFSPAFHTRFLLRRVRAAWGSPDRVHNAVGIAAWGLAATASLALGLTTELLLLWVLPVTVLLQLATVGRILCEHRFPEPALIAARGKEFVCRSTNGVFPGSPPPATSALTPSGLIAWIGWWADMLTVQLFARVFVLVGDAPCHDFHHRRPASGRWTSYIYARQEDVEAGCPGFPLNYGDSWGLFRAIDENLATLASTPREVLRPRAGLCPATAR